MTSMDVYLQTSSERGFWETLLGSSPLDQAEAILELVADGSSEAKLKSSQFLRPNGNAMPHFNPN